MNQVELLAPAGSMEALEAAIKSGADAIYLGGNQFGARAFAKNFDDDELVQAIKLAHLYNVKIYITINTLIYDHELNQVMRYIKFLYENDVDALIVQDLGLMKLVREYYPNLELHASTQMTIHNQAAAKFLHELGVKRVVLARENTLDEITNINQSVSIETEVFVHGALCVCYSGQCLMSGLIGGRSGNRGKCAQPCRKLYELMENDEIIDRNKYMISPKDLNTIEYIDQIIESGVSSLKIEGRMKSPEYVAIVVSTYRKAIDAYYKNKKNYIGESDINNLTQIFNRGFTKGFMFNEQGERFINQEKNSNRGILCGVVLKNMKKELEIKSMQPLHVQDGIAFENYDKGLIITHMKQNGKAVEHVDKGETYTIEVLESIKKGTRVFKTKDSVLENSIKKIHYRRIPIVMTGDFKLFKKPILMIKDDLGNQVEVEEDFIIEKSRNQALDEDKIKEQLSKLGNTPFEVSKIEVNSDDNIFVVIKVINSLRRKAIEALIKLREKRYDRKSGKLYSYENRIDVFNDDNKEIELAVYCDTLEQMKAAFSCHVLRIYVNEDLFDSLDPEIQNKVYCVSNRVKIEPTRNDMGKGIIVSDLGTLYLLKNLKNEKEVITNFNLNVTNSESIEFLKNYASRITLSYELNEKSYEDLCDSGKSILELIVYGYQEAMVSKYNIFHEKENKKFKNIYLVDVKKEKFLINIDQQNHMHIYNSKKLILNKEINTLMNRGYKNFRLNLIDESFEESLRVIKAYQALLYEENGDELNEILNAYKEKNLYTRGYFNKDIL